MVPVTLDKPRNLYFPLGALRDLENALGGRPLGSILHDISVVGINVLVLALFHGLKQEDPTLNPRLVERILDDKLKDKQFRLGPVYDAITDALQETGVFRTEQDTQGKQEAPPIPA